MRIALFALLLTASQISAQGNLLTTTRDSVYTLKPGDVVKIEVWGQEDFSGQFQVNERGMILYPGIGELSANNMNVAALRDTIRIALENIFNRPFVIVTPLFRMAVLGHVRAPGLYNVDPTMTIFDMIALAGGPSSNGDLNKIRLLRAGNEIRLSFRDEGLHGRTLQELGVRSGDQIMVQRKKITLTDVLIGLQAAQLIVSIAIFIRQ